MNERRTRTDRWARVVAPQAIFVGRRSPRVPRSMRVCLVDLHLGALVRRRRLAGPCRDSDAGRTRARASRVPRQRTGCAARGGLSTSGPPRDAPAVSPRFVRTDCGSCGRRWRWLLVPWGRALSSVGRRAYGRARVSGVLRRRVRTRSRGVRFAPSASCRSGRCHRPKSCRVRRCGSCATRVTPVFVTRLVGKLDAVDHRHRDRSQHTRRRPRGARHSRLRGRLPGGGTGDPREKLSRCSRPLEDLVLVRIAASVAGPVSAHGVLSALIWRHRGKCPMPHAWMAAASCRQL